MSADTTSDRLAAIEERVGLAARADDGLPRSDDPEVTPEKLLERFRAERRLVEQQLGGGELSAAERTRLERRLAAVMDGLFRGRDGGGA